MKKLCLNAWLVNFTSPFGRLKKGVIKYGKGDKVIELCNMPILYKKLSIHALEKEVKDLRYKFARLNPLHWHKVYDLEGNDFSNKAIKIIYGSERRSEVLEVNYPANLKITLKFSFEQVRNLRILLCQYH